MSQTWFCIGSVLKVTPMATKKVRVVSGTSDIQTYFENVAKAVDSELETLMPIIARLRLRKQIEYVLGTKGKRIRSTLVMLSGESVGGRMEKLQKMALAAELLHLATLVHDDILDQDHFRRNALAVHAKFSVKEAILVGDALASLALYLGRGYRKKILNLIAQTCLQLSDGEYMDIEITNGALTEDAYFEKVKKKSASLFRASTECGAIAAEGSSSEVNALAGFGENYGIAFQIRDDVIDITSLKNEGSPDINDFRATLPMIYLMETTSENAQTILKRLSAANNKSPLPKQNLLNELHSILENSGSLKFCSRKIDLYIDQAIASLTELKNSVYKGYLVQMADSLRLK